MVLKYTLVFDLPTQHSKSIVSYTYVSLQSNNVVLLLLSEMCCLFPSLYFVNLSVLLVFLYLVVVTILNHCISPTDLRIFVVPLRLCPSVTSLFLCSLVIHQLTAGI